MVIRPPRVAEYPAGVLRHQSPAGHTGGHFVSQKQQLSVYDTSLSDISVPFGALRSARRVQYAETSRNEASHALGRSKTTFTSAYAYSRGRLSKWT